MKTKLINFFQIIFISIIFTAVLLTSTNSALAFCSESNVSGTANYIDGVVTVNITGCIGDNDLSFYQYMIVEQGNTTLLGVSDEGLNLTIGDFTNTDTFQLSEDAGVGYLQIIIIDATNSAEVNRSAADSIPISGITIPIDPGAENLDLVSTFVGGAGSTSQIANIYSTPASLVNVLIKNVFVIAGIILFITILWAGFKFIQSGAKGKDEAKSILTVAITGFIIMFAAYWIVQIIGIVTGTHSLPSTNMGLLTEPILSPLT